MAEFTSLGVKIDTGDSDKSLASLEKGLTGVGAAAKGAGKPLDDLNKSAKNGGQAARSLGGGYNYTATQTEKFRNAINSTIPSLRTMSGLVGGLAGVAGVTKAVKTFASFETQLAKIKTVTQASANEMAQLKERAADLGATTAFSQDQVAAGFLTLSRSGKAVEDQLNIIEPAMNLAITGTISMDDAAGALTTTMSQFGLKSSDAARIADVFTASANSANQTMEEFNSAMIRGAGSLAGIGKSIEETALIVSSLAEVKVVGERAATALRGYAIELATLNDPSAKQAEILQKIKGGFDSINPIANDYITVVRNLSEANLEYTDIIELFGREAGPAFAQVIKKGSESVEELSQKLTNSTTAAEAAAGNMGALETNFKSLESAATAALSSIGEGFSGPVNKGLEIVIEGLLSMKGYIEDNKEVLKGVGDLFIGLVKVVGVLVHAFYEGAQVIEGAFISVFAKIVRWINEAVDGVVKLITLIPGVGNLDAVKELSKWTSQIVKDSRDFDKAAVDTFAEVLKYSDSIADVWELITGENVQTVKELEDQTKEIEKQTKEIEKRIRAEKAAGGVVATPGGPGGPGGTPLFVQNAVAKLKALVAYEEARAEADQKAKDLEIRTSQDLITQHIASAVELSGFSSALKMSSTDLMNFASQLKSGIAGAGPNAARGMRVGEAFAQGGPIAGITELVLSNEKIKEAIDKGFALFFDQVDRLIDPFADMLSAFFDLADAFNKIVRVFTGFELLVAVLEEVARALQNLTGGAIGEINKLGQGAGSFIAGLSGGAGTLGDVGEHISGMFGGTTKDQQKKIDQGLRNQINGFLDDFYASMTDTAIQKVRAIESNFNSVIKQIKQSDASKEARNELKEATRIAAAAALAAEGFFVEARKMAQEAASGGGASAEAYSKAMEQIRKAQVLFGERLIQPALEVVQTAGMSDYEKQLREVHRRYDEQTRQLQDMDPDLRAQYQATLDQARAIEINTVHLAEQKRVQDEATASLQKQNEAVEKQASLVGAFEASMSQAVNTIANSTKSELQVAVYNTRQKWLELAEAAKQANAEAGGFIETGLDEYAIQVKHNKAAQIEVNKLIEESAEQLRQEIAARNELVDSVSSQVLREDFSVIGKSILDITKKYSDMIQDNLKGADHLRFSTEQLADIAEARSSEIQSSLTKAFDGFFDNMDNFRDKLNRLRGSIGGTTPVTLDQLNAKVALLQSLGDEGILNEDLLKKRQALMEEIYTGAQELAQVQKKTDDDHQEALRRMRQLSESLTDQVNALFFSEFNIAAPEEVFAEAERQFEDLRNKAFDAAKSITEADDEAISEFQNFAEKFLGASVNVFKSGQGHVDNFNLVTGDLKALADVVANTADKKLVESANVTDGALGTIVNTLDTVSKDLEGKVNDALNKLIEISIRFGGENIETVGGVPVFNTEMDLVVQTQKLLDGVEIPGDVAEIPMTLAAEVKRLAEGGVVDGEFVKAAYYALASFARSGDNQDPASTNAFVKDFYAAVDFARSGDNQDPASSNAFGKDFEVWTSIDPYVHPASASQVNTRGNQFWRYFQVWTNLTGTLNGEDIPFTKAEGSIATDITATANLDTGLTRLEKVILFIGTQISQTIWTSTAAAKTSQSGFLSIAENALTSNLSIFKEVVGSVQQLFAGKNIPVSLPAILENPFSPGSPAFSNLSPTGSYTNSTIGQTLTFADGGPVYGPSHAMGGVSAELEGGEYVLNRGAVSRIGQPTLNALNSGNLSRASVNSDQTTNYMLRMVGDKLDRLNRTLEEKDMSVQIDVDTEELIDTKISYNNSRLRNNLNRSNLEPVARAF